MVPLALFVMGWTVYAVGFIWTLIIARSQNNDSDAKPAHAAVDFPYYIVLVGGPFVYLSGVLHAILPGLASTIAWMLIVYFNTAYFASLGWVMYTNGLNSTNVNSSLQLRQTGLDQEYNTRAWLMFLGTLFALLCWCSLLILTVFYRSKGDQDKNIDHSQEFLSAYRTHVTHTTKSQIPFTGVSRILSIPAVIISAVGWCVYVAGYWDILNTEPNKIFDDRSKPVVFTTFIIGPLFYLASLLHAGCSGRSSAIGVMTALLHALYVASAGFVIVHLLQHLILDLHSESDVKSNQIKSNINNQNLMLWSCVASLLSATFVRVLVPFYRSFKVSDGAPEPQRPRVNTANLTTDVSLPGTDRDQNHIASAPPPDYAAALNMRVGNNGNEQQPLLGQN